MATAAFGCRSSLLSTGNHLRLVVSHWLLLYAARNARFFILLQERTRRSQAIGEMQVPPQGNIQGFRRQEAEDQASLDHPRETRLAAIILQALMRIWPTDRLSVADRGLREGLLYAQMSADGVLTDGPYL